VEGGRIWQGNTESLAESGRRGSGWGGGREGGREVPGVAVADVADLHVLGPVRADEHVAGGPVHHGAGHGWGGVERAQPRRGQPWLAPTVAVAVADRGPAAASLLLLPGWRLPGNHHHHGTTTRHRSRTNQIGRGSVGRRGGTRRAGGGGLRRSGDGEGLGGGEVEVDLRGRVGGGAADLGRGVGEAGEVRRDCGRRGWVRVGVGCCVIYQVNTMRTIGSMIDGCKSLGYLGRHGLSFFLFIAPL
jgi:hypothetical protein